MIFGHTRKEYFLEKNRQPTFRLAIFFCPVFTLAEIILSEKCNLLKKLHYDREKKPKVIELEAIEEKTDCDTYPTIPSSWLFANHFGIHYKKKAIDSTY